MAKEQFREISIPIHPDDAHAPTSIVHIPLSGGRFATIVGPLMPKTMTMLHDTLLACKDGLVVKPSEPDYEI
jgi:hypothetical protein